MIEKRRFHTLDALRFFAFLKVFLLHIPLQGEFPIFSFLKSGGGIGVSLFFVLSGFLITYLLVVEKINQGQISIKRFFLRRSFRIYPLFFFLVFIAFVLPYNFKQEIGMHMVGGGYELDWRYSFFFLENYKMLWMDNFPKTTPLSVFWSLCIEEHFYIVWMFAIFFLSVKRTLWFLIISIGIAWVGRYLDPIIWQNTMITQNDLFTNIDYFAIGGILGFFVAKEYSKLVSKIQSISTNWKYTFIIAVIGLVIFQDQILPSDIFLLNIFRPTIIAIAFTLLIAIFIPEDSTIRIADNHVISYLGRISYGLYVYHILFVHIIFQYFIQHKIMMDDWLTVGGFMIAVFVGSVIVSMLSFRFLEKPFLDWRRKF